MIVDREKTESDLVVLLCSALLCTALLLDNHQMREIEHFAILN